jgi:c-di-GMP-binding flagellar brake protein YcgR
MNDVSERRQFRRALFTIEDGITGLISISSLPKTPITTYILNLSEGGMNFTLRDEVKDNFKMGDEITLIQLKGSPIQKYLVNIDAKIKWILDQPHFDKIGLGCEFMKISTSSRKQLDSFVNIWQDKKWDS